MMTIITKSLDNLAESITRNASHQTHLTIRLFVDRELVAEAYRAYAYFRWLDDRLDSHEMDKPERIAFLERQKSLVESCYRGDQQKNTTAEEQMLADLIRCDRGKNSGLQSYIRNMMAVLTFDTERRERTISQRELAEYERLLATAVTEALYYFIGNSSPLPNNEARYQAVQGAHVAHMLRDTLDDIQCGYYNIPREYLDANGISARDVDSEAYKGWVQSRVQLARTYFETGKSYLVQYGNLRCRIAGWAYMKSFKNVLNTIEKDGYRLRTQYSDRKNPGAIPERNRNPSRIAPNPMKSSKGKN